MAPTLTIRPGHPDFLDLPWETSLVDWRVPALLDLPKGISRHEVRFLAYPNGIYVVKELQRRPARNDFTVLRALEAAGAPAVRAVGIVEERDPDAGEERSASASSVPSRRSRHERRKASTLNRRPVGRNIVHTVSRFKTT